MNLVTDSPLLNDDNDGIRPMRTNEEQRNRADRRIPLIMVDIMYECLGNMSGPVRKLYYDEDKQTQYMYHNDQGFSKKDEEAILQKNSSGDNSKTVGLNGHGFKVAVDRVVSYIKDKRCKVVSINTQRKCTIGHFDYTQWEHCDVQNEVGSILQKLEIDKHAGGSLFVIPFNDEHHEIYMKEKDTLRKKALLMLNIKIAKNKVKFYWNNELQEIEKICPDEGCVTLDVDFGYDSKSKNLHDKHKKSPLIRINNYELLDDSIKTVIPGQYIMLSTDSNKRYKSHKIEYDFISVENLTMRLNSVPSGTNPRLEEQDQEGFLVYINDECIVHKPLTNKLKGNHGQALEYYGGKPRFSFHISKTSKLFYIPTDKSNIKPTTKGIQLQQFASQFSAKYFTKDYKKDEKDTQSENDVETQSENDVETKLVNDMDTQSESYVDNQSVNDVEIQSVNDIEIQSGDCLFISKGVQEEVKTDVNSELKQRISKDDDNKRENFSPKTINEAFRQQQDNINFFNDNNYNDTYMRCPCCVRILKKTANKAPAGHIIADKEKGTIDLDNCLIICTQCNNNDTRSIPQMMIEEWGVNHVNTKRLEKYLIHMNKQGKDIIPNERKRERIKHIEIL